MVATIALFAALLPAALSDSCAAGPSTQASFITGQVRLEPALSVGPWTPPIAVDSGKLLCDPERGQIVLLGVDGKSRVHLWLLQPQSDRWQVGRALHDLPSVTSVALSEGSLVLGVVRRETAELWLMPAEGKSRPQVRQVGMPIVGLVLSGDRSIWWVATGNELRGFSRDDGSTRESFVFPAPLSALAAVTGSSLLVTAWSDTVVLIDPLDRPARGVLPWRAQAALTEAPSRLEAERVDTNVTVRLFNGHERGVTTILLTPRASSTAVSDSKPSGASPVDAHPAQLSDTRPVRPSQSPEQTPAPPTESKAATPREVRPVDAPLTTQPPATKPREDRPTPREPAPTVESTIAPPTYAGEPSAELASTDVGPACTPDPSEKGVIAGQVDDPSGLATEVVVHGPDNLLHEAARVVLRRTASRICFRIAGLSPGRYRIQVMGANGGSLRTRPQFGNVTFSPDQSITLLFTVDGKL